MIKKIINKYFLLSKFFIIFLFLRDDSVFAAETSLCPGGTVGSCVEYLFKWGVGLAGGLALVSFAWGAVMLIASGDSTEIASSAKDRMKGAILGLILTLASWLIIDTINPNIENTTIKPLP